MINILLKALFPDDLKNALTHKFIFVGNDKKSFEEKTRMYKCSHCGQHLYLYADACVKAVRENKKLLFYYIANCDERKMDEALK